MTMISKQDSSVEFGGKDMFDLLKMKSKPNKEEQRKKLLV